MIRGQSIGLQGNCYAIPTKDQKLNTLPLDIIEQHAKEFLCFAEAHPDMEFHLTPIGCGLAGYTHAQIAPMFHKSPPNVILPDEFAQQLKEEDE